MSASKRAEKVLRRKPRIERRLRRRRKRNTGRPELAASNVHYEVADQSTATNAGASDWFGRPPDPRAHRRAWLTENVREIHATSRHTYGSSRIWRELGE